MLHYNEWGEGDPLIALHPLALEASELEDIITAAIVEADAHSMKDMGKVMALVKAQVAGRADMSVVSSTVKAQLA